MIIYTHGGGRLGNQLIAYSHLIAFIIETHEESDLINLGFWDYTDLFDVKISEKIYRFYPEHTQGKILDLFYLIFKNLPDKLAKKLWVNLIRLLYFYSYFSPNIQSLIVHDATGLSYLIGERQETLNLKELPNMLSFQTTDVTVLGGWKIRNWELFEKQQTFIRNYFMIKNIFRETAQHFIEKLRQEYDLLIGILIRQTDYKTFADGKYFFETEQYYLWMQQVINLFPATSKITFIVASDAPKYLEQFPGLTVHLTTGIAGGQGHYLESMLELSMCDYIMTPPSTFSIWAAFLGEVPVIPLYSITQTIEEEAILKNHIFEAINHPHLSVAVQ